MKSISLKATGGLADLGQCGQLFSTVASRDFLGLWTDQGLDAARVIKLLKLSKTDLATLCSVAPSSVRFDEKIPTLVRDRLEEVGNLCELVAEYFGGSERKTVLWFQTENPLLAGATPRSLILAGRCDTLRRLIVEAKIGNAAQGNSVSGNGAPLHSLLSARLGAIKFLCRRFAVRRLAVFGSLLRNDDFDLAASDIDFAVEFALSPESSPARQYFGFKEALETLFGRPVDLVEMSAMPDSRLKRIIERTQVPVYAETV